MIDRKKRPKTPLSDGEKRIFEAAHNEPFLGTRLLRSHLKECSKRNLSHNKIHRYLLVDGLARPNLQKQKKCTGISRFERHLRLRDINHIPSKRNTPQTNDKIERWYQKYRRYRWWFDSAYASAYAFEEWYNLHIHGALDLKYSVTLIEAFIRKLRRESILGMFLAGNKREVSL